MVKRIKISFTIALILLCLTSQAQLSSTFTSNAENWTTPNDADGIIGYSATGGNPGGFVFGSPFVINLGSGSLYAPFNFVAPSSYLGNRSTYFNGTLRYDIQLSTAGTPNQYAEVTIANNAGITLYYFPATSNQPAGAPAWTTFSVVMNNALGYWKTTNSATGPMATDAQVQSILIDLATLQIRGLYRDANATTRLDNVTFMPPLIVTTQPVSRVVCDGATTTLITAAAGNANITYQWQKDNSPFAGWVDITNAGGYSGATTATLTVNTTGNFGGGTYRCKISGTAVNDAFSSTATITVNANPSAPTTTGSASCVSASLTLSAAGGTAGQYRWYTLAAGGTALAGQTNSTYTTPVLTTTTTYYVSINNGTCESTRTPVVATIATTPAAPSTTGNSSCGPAAITLTAAGGTAGQYRWYTVSTGGTAIGGQTNNTYTTPVISATTTYYVSLNNGACEGARSAVVATINTLPAVPTTNGNSSCGPAALLLNASGGAAGQYRWYTVATGGTAITGQTGATYTSPVISTTTTYYVSVNNGICESARSSVVATIVPVPAKPVITANEPVNAGVVQLCLKAITLTAPSGYTYTWSNGETTQQITTVQPGTYSVIVKDATGCSSVSSDALQVAINTSCINSPPVINTSTSITRIGGSLSIDLSTLLSDPDNNLNLTSLQVIGNATKEGGKVSLDGLVLSIDYSGLQYAGDDEITIRICDQLNVCVEQALMIEVVGDINVFNGISPNGDGKNDRWVIEYIELFHDTQKNKVTLYNRWGDVVWEATNYDNASIVFTGLNQDGNELATGSYFYKIEFSSGRETLTGYLSLKR